MKHNPNPPSEPACPYGLRAILLRRKSFRILRFCRAIGEGRRDAGEVRNSPFGPVVMEALV